MNLAFQAQFHQLELKHAFQIAHGRSTTREVLRLTWKNAVGEAPLVPYYPENPEDVLAWLEAIRQERTTQIPEDGPKVARLALDMLWQDAAAQAAKQPLYQWLGAPSPHHRTHSFRSVGLEDRIEDILERVKAQAPSFNKIKLKLGSGELEFDEELCAKTRELLPKHVLCADVNGGWSPRETLKLLPRLNRLNFAFLEQPVSRDGGDAVWEEVHRGRPSCDLPLYADESLQTVADVHRLAPWIQGVNVKLLKAGTLRTAMATMQAARQHRLRVLLGCMIESSVGITCAAHLGALADDVDLDGALYLAHDDYQGVTFGSEGRVILPTGTGLGGTFTSQHDA